MSFLILVQTLRCNHLTYTVASSSLNATIEIEDTSTDFVISLRDNQGGKDALMKNTEVIVTYTEAFTDDDA